MEFSGLISDLTKLVGGDREEFLKEFITKHFGSVESFMMLKDLYVLEEKEIVVGGGVQYDGETYRIEVTTEYKIRRKTPEELRHDRVDDILARNSIAFHNCIVCNEPILVPKDVEVKTIHGYYHGAPYECMNGRQELI